MELPADSFAPHLAEARQTATRSLSPFIIDKETNERMSFQISHLAPQFFSQLFILNFSVQKAEMTRLMSGSRHVKNIPKSHFMIVIISVRWVLKWLCAIKIKLQISLQRCITQWPSSPPPRFASPPSLLTNPSALLTSNPLPYLWKETRRAPIKGLAKSCHYRATEPSKHKPAHRSTPCLVRVSQSFYIYRKENWLAACVEHPCCSTL